MPDVLLATCAVLPKGDEDADLLITALAAAGVDAEWAAWTDPSVDWSAAPVVIRSTWDYTLHRQDFLDWVDTLPRVHNPAQVVHWNSDKTYLLDLDAADVPITATTVIRPGEAPHLPDSGEFVVKPSIGAGSRGAGRFTADRVDAAREHVAALHEVGRTALVQPYLDGVDGYGETALVYLDGVFSHAVRKGPMLAPAAVHPVESLELFVREQIVRREPSAAELAVGARAVAALVERFGGPMLYARVDLLPSQEGPVVVELELTEPSLFLQYEGDDGPATRLSAAIARAL